MLKKLMPIIFILLIIISSFAFAADPKLVTKVSSGLSTIKEWIIKISTPAAAVAIGVGVLMKKFSFGDEERIVMR